MAANQGLTDIINLLGLFTKINHFRLNSFGKTAANSCMKINAVIKLMKKYEIYQKNYFVLKKIICKKIKLSVVTKKEIFLELSNLIKEKLLIFEVNLKGNLKFVNREYYDCQSNYKYLNEHTSQNVEEEISESFQQNDNSFLSNFSCNYMEDIEEFNNNSIPEHSLRNVRKYVTTQFQLIEIKNEKLIIDEHLKVFNFIFTIIIQF